MAQIFSIIIFVGVLNLIALFAGTTEGKEVLFELNKYTDDIFVSTATEYGGELLQNYKYKKLNTKPLNYEAMLEEFRANDIKILIDASHPYAVEVSKNLVEACSELNIKYNRILRASVVDKYLDSEFVIEVHSYENLKEHLIKIDGTILNTTGSRGLDKIMGLRLNNRIIHRVLPSLKVMGECFEKGLNVENLIFIKGPIGYELNCAFIKEYNAKAIILKDSGTQGGTEEKLKAAIDLGIHAFVIGRQEKATESSKLDIKKILS